MSDDKNKVEQVRLAISICSNRTIPARTSIALSFIIHHLTAFGVPFGMMNRLQASLLPQARQDCLNEALSDKCTHMLWLDDDIEPPGDCVLRMLHSLKVNPHMDAIGVNYCRKQDDLQYTAIGMDGKLVESFNKLGLEEVTACGMGLMLVRLDKLYKIPAPHFEVVWHSDLEAYRGEDHYFIKKLREHGCRIFIDHGISNFTQHWGELGYSFRLWHPEANKDQPYATLTIGANSMGKAK